MDYFEMNGCPGRFFRCERLRANLSVTSCAARWREANAKGAPERLANCNGCPIGAEHAGEPLVLSSPLYDRRICTRCHRPSDRLINEEHCPSCYNREREFIIGRNAKGTRPVKNTGLHPVTVRYAACGRPSERRLNLALDTTEAVVSVLRRTRGEVVFAFAPPGVLKAQWSLF